MSKSITQDMAYRQSFSEYLEIPGALFPTKEACSKKRTKRRQAKHHADRQQNAPGANAAKYFSSS